MPRPKPKYKQQLSLRLDPDIKEFIDSVKTEYGQTSMQGFILFMIREFRKHHNKQQKDD